jgi:hypothetical protein
MAVQMVMEVMVVPVVMVELCEELFACQRSVVILQGAYVFARRQASLVNKMTGNNKKV